MISYDYYVEYIYIYIVTIYSIVLALYSEMVSVCLVYVSRFCETITGYEMGTLDCGICLLRRGVQERD